MMTEQETQLDPQVYFDLIKDKKYDMTDEFINQFQEVIESELAKAMKTGQEYVVRRLAYCMSIVSKERELLKQGISCFVLKEDVEQYIDKVADKVVKVIELEQYPRSIPDDIVEKVAALKELNLFDRYFVVFTDYTGEVEQQVEKERRKKDPIIFGGFEQKIDGIWDVFDRLYFIADWEDEYCDLTLTKMVEAMSKKGKQILHPAGIEKPTPEAVRAYINALDETRKDRFSLRPIKQSYFKNISVASANLIKELIPWLK